MKTRYIGVLAESSVCWANLPNKTTYCYVRPIVLYLLLFSYLLYNTHSCISRYTFFVYLVHSFILYLYVSFNSIAVLPYVDIATIITVGYTPNRNRPPIHVLRPCRVLDCPGIHKIIDAWIQLSVNTRFYFIKKISHHHQTLPSYTYSIFTFVIIF